MRNNPPVRLFKTLSPKDECSKKSDANHVQPDWDIKSPQIKYADDTEADSMIDIDAEGAQSNMDSLVNRMNPCN